MGRLLSYQDYNGLGRQVRITESHVGPYSGVETETESDGFCVEVDGVPPGALEVILNVSRIKKVFLTKEQISKCWSDVESKCNSWKECISEVHDWLDTNPEARCSMIDPGQCEGGKGKCT